MGWGDAILATGLSRGSAARGRRAAFGDGETIRWDQHCAPIFQRNPNVAPPGSEAAPDVEWIAHYKGCRAYNRQDGRRWAWNYDFKAIPGEIFLAEAEIAAAKRAGKNFILVEPNVPAWKSSAPNKDWGRANYQEVTRRLRQDGNRIVQLLHGRDMPIAGVEAVKTYSFRDALAILRRARLFIGPEGGLHHGAAAVGVQGVVLFGGFIPPSVTGYDTHANLTGGAEACGSLFRCEHCVAAMRRISVEDVMAAARAKLQPGARGMGSAA